ncbi:MAG TPA: NAD(P)-dependent oxidoreductase [Lacunisphaera sp.]|nr:NAD(P)-dependent oxidoreductase [Lacunisphaera sp.]
MPAEPLSPSSAAVLPCTLGEADDFLSSPNAGVLACLSRQRGPFLVLGAGGKMGLHLSLMLAKGLRQLGRPDEVIAVSRFSSLRDTADFTKHQLKTIACDLSDPDALARLPDAPTVFFLAGIKFGTQNAPELLQKMNVEMPRLVAQRFRGSLIVAFSSGCVYPFVSPDSGGATEQTPPDPIGDYAASCVARESAFQKIAAGHGTRVALIRLNYSVEFRYGLLLDVAQSVAREQPVDVTMGYVNVIWQGEAVARIIRCLDLAAAPAQPVNIAGHEILSVRKIAAQFGRLLGRTPAFNGMEAPKAWLNNASLAHARFGRPAIDSDQMIRWVAAWLQAGGSNWGKPTGFERRDGKF